MISPITSSAELAERAAAVAKGSTFIAVDTEFMRERTYYPVLCLVQVAGENGESFCVDTLAEGIDLAPLYALFADSALLKVFHAARQDLEIFYHRMGRVPAPLFDTQVAAQFTGLGESVSYGDFIRRTLGHTVDKGAQFTDWARRPLSPRQLTYAMEDVTHLAVAYAKQRADLVKLGRLAWVEEEMARLADASLYDASPADAWKRLRSNRLKPRELVFLQRLAAWREEEARTQDVPRGRVIKDDTLVELAAHLPQQPEDLKQLRSSSGGVNARYVQKILAISAEVRALPESEIPRPERERRPEPANESVVQFLQMVLSAACRRHRILPRMVATRDDLEALALGKRDVPALSDWRQDIFGTAAVQALSGALHISIDAASGEVVFSEKHA